jgi:hypothetical protein
VSKTTKTDEVCTFMIEVFDFESSLGEIMYTAVRACIDITSLNDF